jgi:RNA polymerase sigma factor (sigma-70 family)
MNPANFEAFHAANKGLIHEIARRAYRRLVAIGAGIEFDDLVQDLTIIFMRAYGSFDEARGVKFSTYFARCALNRANFIAKKFEIERIELGIRSVEELDGMGDDGSSIVERIASDDLTPEQTAEWNEIVDRMDEQLSPLAHLILRWMVEPPDFLEREQCAQCAHAEYARSRGVEKRAMRTPTVTFVARVLRQVWGIPAAQMRAALQQITQFRRSLA